MGMPNESIRKNTFVWRIGKSELFAIKTPSTTLLGDGVGVGFFVVGVGVGFFEVVFFGVGVGFFGVFFFGVGVGVGFFVLAASELWASPLVARPPNRIRNNLREKLLMTMDALSVLGRNRRGLPFQSLSLRT